MISKRHYKKCVVPKCTSSTTKTPEKHFFTVPENSKRRKQWLLAMNRTATDYSPNSKFSVCEDHFDLPNDMENYTKFIYGKDLYSKHGLKPSAVPRLFDCQKDPNHVNKTLPRITSINRARKSIVEDILAASEEKSDQSSESTPIQDISVPKEKITQQNSEPMLVQELLVPKKENTEQNYESMLIQDILAPKEEIIELDFTPTTPPLQFVSVSEDTESSDLVTEDCLKNPSSDFKTIILHRDEPKPGIIREYLGFKKFTRDIGVQCNIRPKIRSKRVQTSNKYFAKDVALSPIRFESPPKPKVQEYISEESYESESSTSSDEINADPTYDPEDESMIY